MLEVLIVNPVRSVTLGVSSYWAPILMSAIEIEIHSAHGYIDIYTVGVNIKFP